MLGSDGFNGSVQLSWGLAFHTVYSLLYKVSESYTWAWQSFSLAVALTYITYNSHNSSGMFSVTIMMDTYHRTGKLCRR